MALKHILGNVPVIKILDFLLDHRGGDYIKAEIAEYADVGQADMKRDFHCLIDCEMIVETRKIGGVQLFKLSEQDIIIDALSDLISTIDHEYEEIDEAEIKTVSETHREDGSLTIPSGFGVI